MKKLLVLIVLAFCAASAVWADLVIEETVVPTAGGATQTAKFYITPTSLALTQGTGGMIFLSEKQVLWQYDTGQHLYIEFTPESMKGLEAQTKSMVTRAVDSLKKQLESAPADQKAAIQKAIDQLERGPVFSFRRLAGERTVAGYRCAPVDVLVNGQSQSKICAAPISALGMTSGDLKVFETLAKFYSHMGNEANPGGYDLPGLKKFLGYAAFPVQETSEGADGTTVTTITSIKHQSVPASFFALPPGLTKQDILGGN